MTVKTAGGFTKQVGRLGGARLQGVNSQQPSQASVAPRKFWALRVVGAGGARGGECFRFRNARKGSTLKVYDFGGLILVRRA